MANKNENMGLVCAETELINAYDLAMVSRNVIDKDELRHIFVNGLVDTGSYILVINKNIQ
jgi:hypothetical protein